MEPVRVWRMDTEGRDIWLEIQRGRIFEVVKNGIDFHAIPILYSMNNGIGVDIYVNGRRHGSVFNGHLRNMKAVELWHHGGFLRVHIHF